MLNLDTDILLHAVAGRLTAGEVRLLGNNPWSISGIVLWEVAKLAQLKRIEVDLDDPEVQRVLSSVQVWPITPEIAKASTRLDVRVELNDETHVQVGTITVGEYIGEGSLLAQGPAPSHVVAATDVEVLLVQPKDVYDLAVAYPALWAELRDAAAERARELEARLESS